MAISYTVLKAELQNDPQALGYGPLLAAGNHGAIADLLNETRQTIDLARDTAPAWEVFDAIVPADWTALSNNEKQRIQTIMSMGTVSMKGTNTRNAFLAAFPAGSGTRTALAALQNQKGSRAEQLFGVGILVHPSDIPRALEA